MILDRKNRGSALTLLAVLLCATSVRAEDFYVANSAINSGSGASADNAFGVNFFNTATNWGAGAGKISAGDTVRLVGTISTTLTVQGSGSSGSPITIYFEPGASLSKPTWGVDTAAALYANSKNFITLAGAPGALIECTANGDGLANKNAAYGIALDRCNNWKIQGLTIRNIYRHVYGTSNAVPAYTTRGISANTCSNLSVSSCTINHAYIGVYCFSSGGAVSNQAITNNTVSNCSTALICAIGNTGDSFDNILIASNDIAMGANWFEAPNQNHIDGIHCWGIAGGSYTNLQIRSNYIHGDPSTHCTSQIFVETNVSSPLVCSNLVVGSANKPNGGYIGVTGTGNTRIYNNTVVGIAASSAGGIGIYPGGASGTTYEIKNNIVTNCFVAIYEPAGGSTLASDYNCYFNNGYVGWRTTASASLSSWQNAARTDANSLNVNPVLSSAFTITTSSPAAGKATSSVASFVVYDVNQTLRSQSTTGWDIGAFNSGASTLSIGANLPLITRAPSQAIVTMTVL